MQTFALSGTPMGRSQQMRKDCRLPDESEEGRSCRTRTRHDSKRLMPALHSFKASESLVTQPMPGLQFPSHEHSKPRSAGEVCSHLCCSILVLCCVLAAVDWKLPFGPWQRASEAPILSPQGKGWESAGTFNPAVVMHDGKFVMLYRAQDEKGTSRLGLCRQRRRHPLRSSSRAGALARGRLRKGWRR